MTNRFLPVYLDPDTGEHLVWQDGGWKTLGAGAGAGSVALGGGTATHADAIIIGDGNASDAANDIKIGRLDFGATAPAVTGAHGSNAALISLLTVLETMGLITDGTS